MKYQYGKWVPYGFDRVLSTYWDWEHFPVIHPRTLGEARVLTYHGKCVLFEQRWPRYAGVRLRSLIEAEFVPPDVVTIRILRGIFRGTFVRTVFSAVTGDRLEAVICAIRLATIVSGFTSLIWGAIVMAGPGGVTVLM